MARLFENDSQLGGYNCEFVSPSDPPAGLLCLICRSVARSPRQMDCCGKIYCKKCLAENRKSSLQCPNCRESGKSFPDKRAERDILELKVKCNKHKKGCQWTGELRLLEEHEKRECDYTTIMCPNHCQQCYLRKDLTTHLQHQCTKRQHSCPDCGERGPFDKLTKEHPLECPNAMVKCTNKGCDYTGWRSNMKMHKCPYEPVPCKYANIGCKEVLTRKTIERHEQDSAFHLHLTSEVVGKLRQEVEDLKDQNKVLEGLKDENKILKAEAEDAREEIESSKENIGRLHEHILLHQEKLKLAMSKIQELTQENVQMKKTIQKNTQLTKTIQSHLRDQHKNTFRVFPFSTHKETDSDFSSERFCSGLYGYEYKIDVICNGEHTVEGVHVSVYVYLLKGANDDSLTWPFTGTFVIELLNQLEDKNHYTQLITHPRGNEAARRVVNGIIAPSGYGYHQFIAYTELGYKPHQNCQYLKDDKLFFRVSVQLPDSKPWLEQH